MAIRESTTPEGGAIALDDMDDWRTFAEANADALVDGYGSIEAALQHCRDGGLTLGGGAAPLFFIYFAE